MIKLLLILLCIQLKINSVAIASVQDNFREISCVCVCVCVESTDVVLRH